MLLESHNQSKTLVGAITEYHASGRNSKLEKTTKLINAGDGLLQGSNKCFKVTLGQKVCGMPILASDAYPGKQIAPISYAQSKKAAITCMFVKTDSATLIRQTQNSASTLSPSAQTSKQTNKVSIQARKTKPRVTPDAIMLEISDIQLNESEEFACMSRASLQLVDKSKSSLDFLSEFRMSGQVTPNMLPPMNLGSIRNSVQPSRVSIPSTINSKDSASDIQIKQPLPTKPKKKEMLPAIKTGAKESFIIQSTSNVDLKQTPKRSAIEKGRSGQKLTQMIKNAFQKKQNQPRIQVTSLKVTASDKVLHNCS